MSDRRSASILEGPARAPARAYLYGIGYTDEDRVIRRANMHLVGRQLDPARVRRDLWRLAEWERRRGDRQQVPQSHR